MRILLALAVLLMSFSGFAQDKIKKLEGSKIRLNYYGDNVETSTDEPVLIVVDRDAETVTIKSGRQDINKLFKGQMVRKLQSQMGDEGTKYSYQLDDNIMMHVHADLKMILFTRSDIHPLEWGLQVLDFEIAE